MTPTESKVLDDLQDAVNATARVLGQRVVVEFGENQKLRADNSVLKHNIKQMDAANSTLTTESSILKEEIASLRNQLLSQATTYRSNMEGLKDDNKSLHAINERLHGELVALRVSTGQQTLEAETMRLREQITNLGQFRDRQALELERLREQLATEKRLVSDIGTQMAEDSRQHKQTKQLLLAVEHQRDQLQKEYNALMTRMADIRHAMNKAI